MCIINARPKNTMFETEIKEIPKQLLIILYFPLFSELVLAELADYIGK